MNFNNYTMRYIISFTLLLPVALLAQPGSLDPTFSNGGTIIYGQANANDRGEACVVQPDGKIITVGSTATVADPYGWMQRFHANGITDTTFGNNGIVMIDHAVGLDQVNGISLQQGGSIFVTGDTWVVDDLHLFVSKYDSTGAIDTSFANNGTYTDSFIQPTTSGGDLVIYHDNVILAAGQGPLTPYMPCIDSIGNQNGAGSNFGWATHGDQHYGDVARHSDSTFVIVGDGLLNSREILVNMRRRCGAGNYTPFGMNGLKIIDATNGADRANAVAIDDVGRVVIAGSAQDSTGFDLLLMRLLQNGDVDTTFGNNGLVRYDHNLFTFIGEDLVLQPDGKILVLANTATAGPTPFYIARYMPDGSLDTSFGMGGVAGFSTPFMEPMIGSSLTLDDSCRVLVNGVYGYIGTHAFLARVQLGNCQGIITAIEDNHAPTAITIYPNPTHGQVRIEVPKMGQQPSEIRIFCMTGKTVHRRSFTGSSVNMDLDLNPGPYLVTVTNGEEQYRTRLIVQ